MLINQRQTLLRIAYGGVAEIIRNRRPTSAGIGGRLRPESPAGIIRNGWPTSIGISGRNQSEWVAEIVRNMQLIETNEVYRILIFREVKNCG